MFTRLLSSLLFNFARLLSFLPFNLLYIKSSFFAFFIFRVIGYRKNVIIQNLCRSFPELKYNEISSLTRGFYKHFSDVFIEVVKGISLSHAEFVKRYRVENIELINQYHQQDKTVIGLTGHIGNWEWLGLLPSLEKDPVYTLYKPLRSKVAEGVITKIRSRFGMRLLSMSNAARFILNTANKRNFYIFIGDQSPTRVDNASEFNFLNQKTTFFTGGAKLAIATKSAIVYISIKKMSRGYYTLKLIPIDYQPILNETSNKLKAENFILSEYARFLEKDIRDNPVAWLWSHKRWKHP